MYASVKYWIGKLQQDEYFNLSSNFFHSEKKGQLVGRKNENSDQIEGAAAFYNNKMNIIVSSFDQSKPLGWAKTYYENQEEIYSFYETGKRKPIYDDLKYIADQLLEDDKNGPANSARNQIKFSGL